MASGDAFGWCHSPRKSPPKKRSLKRQSLINVPTEVMLRAISNKMAAAENQTKEIQRQI